jgi:two-component system response regulator NreC
LLSASGDLSPLTLVLADDHIVVRTGLSLVLEQAGIHVVAQAADAESAVRKVLGHKPDVLLLDYNMPGALSAVEAIPLALAASPKTRICMLTMQKDAESARRALRAGASGYVLKDGQDAEVVAAIRQVAAGGTYLNPRMGAEMAAAPSPADVHDHILSSREIEVLRLVALGHTNAEMAAQLSFSLRTVESHRADVQRKLGRQTRSELVRYALDSGLLDDVGAAPRGG